MASLLDVAASNDLEGYGTGKDDTKICYSLYQRNSFAKRRCYS